MFIFHDMLLDWINLFKKKPLEKYKDMFSNIQ